MSANSDDNMRPSWIKENLSQILLSLALFMVIVSLVIYFFSDALSNSILADENIAAKPISVEQPPAKMITENWQEDPVDEIEDTQLSVGVSDLNDKRIVISKEELIDLEERYIVDVVDVAKTSSAQQPKMQTQQNSNVQPNLSIIKMNKAAQSSIDLLNEQNKSFVNQQAEISLPAKAAGQSQLLDLILTPANILLDKPPHLFTLKLSGLETQAQLLTFIGQYELPEENFYIYQKSPNKQPRFVIIVGEYASFSAAKKAQQSLSASLLSLPPSIITYQEIHQDLQLNND